MLKGVYSQYVFFCNSASSSADNLDWDFPILDQTPRRFSTGAPTIPMPAPQVLVAQAVHEIELEERTGSRARTPQEKQDISAAINRFQMCSATPSFARLAALASPCYLHKRFGDAVDIDKVLEDDGPGAS